jgi:pectate lyase
MDQKLNFTIFCLESYKCAHSLTGKVAVKLFAEHNVFDYLDACYDVLHSTGQQFIVADIDRYLRSRQIQNSPRTT